MALDSVIKFIRGTSLTLQRKEEVLEGVWVFDFLPDTLLDWQAGQHGLVEVKLPSGRWDRRMFSISSAPSEGVVRIATRVPKERTSTFKQALASLPLGGKARLRGPMGPFFIKDPSRRSVFVAGGIGITPYRSMLQDLHAKGLPLNATLIHATREGDQLYKEELAALQQQYPEFVVRYVVEPERVTEDLLKEVVPDLDSATFFLSGPPAMVKTLNETLKAVGARVVKDTFRGYK